MKKKRREFPLTVVVTVAVLTATWTGGLQAAEQAVSADWPHFLGSAGNSMAAETAVNRAWGSKPPRELWRFPMQDQGHSGPAVADGTVYVLDHVGDDDVVRALDLSDGKQRWELRYPQPGPENNGLTRSTPTVSDGFVYVTSRFGDVTCVSTSGQKRWSVNVVKAHDGKIPKWELANSAVIDGNKVIVLAGGTNANVVALDKTTGREIWAGGGSDIPGYATPLPTVIGGRPQYLVFTGKGLMGVAPDSGARLWYHPWETRLDVNAASPIRIGDDRVWIASGYRKGSVLLRIADNTPEVLWTHRKVSPHWSSGVLVDGHIYTTTAPGYLVCLDVETGEEVWRSRGTARGFEHGGLCAVGGTLIVIEGNTGNVVQVEITPEAYRELGRISPLGDAKRCWTAPVVADGRLLVRSPDELVCVDIRP